MVDMIEVSPLKGYSKQFGTVQIDEITGRSLVSVAVPLGGDAKIRAAVKKAYKCALPGPMETAASKTDEALLINMAPGQFFIAYPQNDPWPNRHVAGRLGDAGYYVDQSDAWVSLRIAGKDAVAALERICPLDLDLSQFPVGAAKRTGMEHMTAMVLRESEDAFVLMSASSSAESFLHAVVTSARNVT